jgi:Terminase small subunit
MPRQLTIKQRAFIAAYLTGITATQAAVDAGYSRHSAKAISHQLMHDNELVKAELARVHQHMAKTAEYNAEQAVQAIDAFIAKADARGADNAIAKFHEQKMKLYGLLIDKQQIDINERVDLRGALEAANARVNPLLAARVEEQVQQRLAEALRLRCDPVPAIEGDFVALPSVVASGSIDGQSVEPQKNRSVPRETERAIWHDLKPSFNPDRRP